MQRIRFPKSSTDRAGFSLVELIAILAISFLMVLTFLPALAGSRTKAQCVRCLNNLRQIAQAASAYTHDNHDLFPPNPDDGTTSLGYTWCVGQAGIGGGEEFNPDILIDSKRCLIAAYLTTNASVFRCTADSRTGKYDGAALYPNSPLIGQRVPAARTISMSEAVGTIDPQFNVGGGHSGVPNLPVNGPWLTGSHGGNHSMFGPYRTYGRISQMVIPVPAQLIVMTEESPFSINEASLAMSVNPAYPIWVDYPNTLHNNGCVMNFADGHVEFHKWVGSVLILTAPATGQRLAPQNDPDWLWFAERISARF
jgi:prepilin-type processing-associated H-X9-DG protein